MTRGKFQNHFSPQSRLLQVTAEIVQTIPDGPVRDTARDQGNIKHCCPGKIPGLADLEVQVKGNNTAASTRQ